MLELTPTVLCKTLIITFLFTALPMAAQYDAHAMGNYGYLLFDSELVKDFTISLRYNLCKYLCTRWVGKPITV